jgi:hypothetical protein
MVRPMRARLFFAVATLSVCGCSSSGGDSSNSSPDGSSNNPDSGSNDSSPDGGPNDSGPDGGSSDSGPSGIPDGGGSEGGVGCHTGGGSCSAAADCCSKQCDQDGTCAYAISESCTESDTCVANTACYNGKCRAGIVCAKMGKSCTNTIGCCTPSAGFCGGSGYTCLACNNPGGLPSNSPCNVGGQCCSGSCRGNACD